MVYSAQKYIYEGEQFAMLTQISPYCKLYPYKISIQFERVILLNVWQFLITIENW